MQLKAGEACPSGRRISALRLWGPAHGELRRSIRPRAAWNCSLTDETRDRRDVRLSFFLRAATSGTCAGSTFKWRKQAS